MAKRIITPHKGGRTDFLKIRCKPDVKRKMNDIKDRTEKSAGDLIEGWIITEWDKLFSNQETTESED